MRIPPGAERPFRGVDWADALVVVEHGILELETPGGAQTLFVTGDIPVVGRCPATRHPELRQRDGAARGGEATQMAGARPLQRDASLLEAEPSRK
jgi:hypothetical protein